MVNLYFCLFIFHVLTISSSSSNEVSNPTVGSHESDSAAFGSSKRAVGSHVGGSSNRAVGSSKRALVINSPKAHDGQMDLYVIANKLAERGYHVTNIRYDNYHVSNALHSREKLRLHDILDTETDIKI